MSVDDTVKSLIQFCIRNGSYVGIENRQHFCKLAPYTRYDATPLCPYMRVPSIEVHGFGSEYRRYKCAREDISEIR